MLASTNNSTRIEYAIKRCIDTDFKNGKVSVSDTDTRVTMKPRYIVRYDMDTGIRETSKKSRYNTLYIRSQKCECITTMLLQKTRSEN